MKNTQRKIVQRDEQPAGEELARVKAHDIDQRSHNQEDLPPVDKAPPEGVMTGNEPENESGQEAAVPVLLTTEEKVGECPEDEQTAPVATPVEIRPTRKQLRKRAKEGEQLEGELRDVYKPKNKIGVTKAKTYKV